MIMSFVYGILAVIVIFIGIGQVGSSIDDLTDASITGLIVGLLIIAVGFFLIFVGIFAAFLFAATRGADSPRALSITDAYVTTFRLIAELGLAIIFGIVLFIIGNAIGGGLATLLFFIGFLTFLFFPSASLFYVVNWIRNFH